MASENRYPEFEDGESALAWMEARLSKTWVDRAIEENVHVSAEASTDPEDPFWQIINGGSA